VCRNSHKLKITLATGLNCTPKVGHKTLGVQFTVVARVILIKGEF